MAGRLLAAAPSQQAATLSTVCLVRYTVTSHVNGLLHCHEISARPPNRLPSCFVNPTGSLFTGVPADTNGNATMSFRAWCLAIRPAARLQMKAREPRTCTQAWLACEPLKCKCTWVHLHSPTATGVGSSQSQTNRSDTNGLVIETEVAWSDGQGIVNVWGNSSPETGLLLTTDLSFIISRPRTYILLRFYLLSSIFFFISYPPSQLTDRNSSKTGHVLGSENDLKMHVQNLGYHLTLKIGGPTTTNCRRFWRLRNLTATSVCLAFLLFFLFTLTKIQ